MLFHSHHRRRGNRLDKHEDVQQQIGLSRVPWRLSVVSGASGRSFNTSVFFARFSKSLFPMTKAAGSSTDEPIPNCPKSEIRVESGGIA